MDSHIRRCFEILEVDSGCTFEEAKESYRLLVQVWHPDKHAHSEKLQAKATNKLKEINAALAYHSFCKLIKA